MLNVVTFLYKPDVVYWGSARQAARASYSARDVNILAAMVQRHLKAPHRFICITDDATGIKPEIETFPLWAHMKGQKRNYRRLRLMSDEVTGWIGGDTFLQIDLDTVIVGDITPLIAKATRATVWRCPSQGRTGSAFNPSLMYFRRGELDHVWQEFQRAPQAAMRAVKAKGLTGTDQGVIGLHADAFDTWTDADGVISYRDHIDRPGLRNPPPHARLVGFYGNYSVPHLAADNAWIRWHWHDGQDT